MEGFLHEEVGDSKCRIRRKQEALQPLLMTTQEADTRRAAAMDYLLHVKVQTRSCSSSSSSSRTETMPHTARHEIITHMF